MQPITTPLITTSLATIYALLLLSHPPPSQWRLPYFLPFLALLVLAFTSHVHLSPWHAVDDIFARTLYIWAAHVSYVFLILGLEPPAQRAKCVWAAKVARARYVGEYGCRGCGAGAGRGKEMEMEGGRDMQMGFRQRREASHDMDRLRFCAVQGARGICFAALVLLYDVFVPVRSEYPPAPFFRRIPASLAPREVALRLQMMLDVCVMDMFFFSALYSFVALVCVGLRIDDAAEWSVSLFGSLRDATSLRNYWGRYWHDLISASFSGHAKLLTRGVWRMEKGKHRRVVENALVFMASGLLHAAVRYVQTQGQGEVWTVAMWYVAQMLAFIGEDVVGVVWVGSRARRWVRGCVGARFEAWESIGGYVWVGGWMFWSVSKYLITRHEWEVERWRKRYSGISMNDESEH